MKRIISVFCCVFLILGCLSGCSRGGGEGAVYYLNFKPEQDAAWKALAKTYTEQTGVKVTIVTAASGTYEDTLAAEIVKSAPPTLFQVNGPVGLSGWKEYCYDLSDSAVYRQLTEEDFALEEEDQVYGIAYALETYGLIYNKTLLDRYFALENAQVSSLEEVDTFASFKALAEDIQANKEALGIEGAFTSAGMDSSSDWRFKTHLANLPIYYEYEQEDIDYSPAIKGAYLEEYRAIWDLYLKNSTCAPGEIGAKTADDALNEFNNAEAVFYQNGTWAWGDAMQEKIGAENVGMMPIYIGAEGEEDQGLCTGSENYWCVNKTAPQKDIDATLAFLEWVVTSEEGTKALAEDMGFESPFKSAKKSQNPLIQIADQWIEDGKTPVAWDFSTIPSDQWKNNVGAALLSYAQGGMTEDLWRKVETAFVEGWRKEYSAAH